MSKQKKYLSENERILSDDIKKLTEELSEVQNEIEKICENCETYKHSQLEKRRTALRRDIVQLQKELKRFKKGRKIR